MKQPKDRIVSDTDVVNKVAGRCSFTKTEITEVYNHIVKVLVESIEDGMDIKIRDLGRLEIRYMAPRKAVDLVHKRKIEVCAKNKAVFVPVSRLKDILEYGLKLPGKDYSSRLSIPTARRKMVTRLQKWLTKREEQDKKKQQGE